MELLTEKHLEKIQLAGEQLLKTIDLTAMAAALKIIDPHVTCTADSLAKDLRNYVGDIMADLRQDPEVDPCKRRVLYSNNYLYALRYYLTDGDGATACQDLDAIVEQSEWTLDIHVSAIRCNGWSKR